jgi:hypothetical protein
LPANYFSTCGIYFIIRRARSKTAKVKKLTKRQKERNEEHFKLSLFYDPVQAFKLKLP